MYKYFLKPLKVIFMVYLFTALGIASDIAQLTNFNILDFLKEHSPYSYYLLVLVTLVIYLVFVIVELIKRESNYQSLATDFRNQQIINTRNVKKSSIIQVNKGKED